MKNKTILYFLLYGILISPLRADSDQSSTSVPLPDKPQNETSNANATRNDVEVAFVDLKNEETTLNVTRRIQSPAENESSVFKPHKIKKKILIANLKNSTEKVSAGEKYDKHGRNVTEEEVTLKPLNGTFEEGFGDVANVTEGRRAKLEDVETAGGSTQNDTFEPETDKSGVSEGRSFSESDVRRKNSGNFKFFNRKNKVTTSTTENYGSKFTTNSYMYFTLGEVQKSVNNNYLNVNEDLNKSSKTEVITSNAPSLGTTATLPRVNPAPISNGNSAKNLVRLENAFHGTTNETDWIPLVPAKTPGFDRNLTFTQNSSPLSNLPTTTLRPTTANPFLKPITPFTGRRRLTTEATVFSTGVTRTSSAETVLSTTPASNSIPLLEHKENSRKGSVDFRKVNRTTSVPNKDLQKPNKLRGSIRFRPAVNNATESYDTLKRNGTRISNATGDGLQKLESPSTGTWDSPVHEFLPVRITTTETVRIESKPRNKTLPGTLLTPKNDSVSLEVVKPKNIAKVQVLKNIVSDKVASASPMSIFKFSETEPPSNSSKSFEATTKPTAATSVSEEVTTVKTSTDQTSTVETSINETVREPNDDEIDLTLSREILKVSTVTPRTVTNVDTTTMRDDITTTEGSVTVETEKEALYTTEEPIPETTMGMITEHDIEMSTEVPVEDVPIPPKQSNSSVIIGYEGKPVTEKENDIEFLDIDGNVMVNTTETDLRDDVTPYEYHPFHPKIHHEITEETVPAYLKLTVEAASWEELCRLKDDLKNAIIRMLDGTNVTAESIVFLNLNEKNCRQKVEETKDDPPSNMPMFLPVNMFIMNENGDFDKNLSEAFLNVWGQYGLDFELPIRKVDFLSPLGGLYELPNDSVGVSVIAAIVISCVAGLCVILLGILFVVMKRRQKRFNYGQRCTPVSLDAYSLDSVSIHNSVRRKGMRASKRSYGNAAFDDPEIPSHSMNFAGLANFSSDKEQLYEEFNIIPQVYPKTDELPAGAETKNRYANVIPLPETRVHLNVKDGDSLSDYINANYVRGLKGAEKLYIACQAPMESTVEDFWRMIWEQQCKVILMLTDLQENGVEKCFDYLPPNEVTDNLRLFGDFQVTMKKRDVKEKYVISHLKLKNMEANLWREVTHLWYLGWPEQGVPSEANSLIAFLIEARSQMKSQAGSTAQGPAVVHCSPGTGRTGTVIACDLCIREFEQTRMVDIPKCVFNLRKDRAGSVQTKDQYAFIYQVLNVYATKLTGGGLESI